MDLQKKIEELEALTVKLNEELSKARDEKIKLQVRLRSAEDLSQRNVGECGAWSDVVDKLLEKLS